MKGFTIQHSIDLLEKKVDQGSGGGSSSASDITYDNTTSGLSSTSVQGAIDEIDGSVDTISSKLSNVVNYSTTETEVGTWIDGRTVYRKVVDVGAFPNSTSKTVAHEISDLDICIGLVIFGTDTNHATFILPNVTTNASNVSFQISCYIDATNINIGAGSDRSGFSGYAIVTYVKTAPVVSNTRKKK